MASSNPQKSLTQSEFKNAVADAVRDALIETLANDFTRYGVDPADVEKVVDKSSKHIVNDVYGAIADVVWEEIGEGKQVRLPDLVTLVPKFAPAKPKRMVRNPQTGEQQMSKPRPARVRIVARPAASLKNGGVPTPKSAAGRMMETALNKRVAERAKRARARTRAEQNGQPAAKATGRKPAASRRAGGRYKLVVDGKERLFDTYDAANKERKRLRVGTVLKAS